MKNKITALLAVILLASCSAPKYSYYFDHYKYNTGKKQNQGTNESARSIDQPLLMASTSRQPIVLDEAVKTAATSPIQKTSSQLTKSDRKTLRHELKKEIKRYTAAKRNLNLVKTAHASGMDHDLKLAAIFGAIGIVGLILNSVTVAFGIIGGIALIIGIVFFVKWLIRQ